MLMQIQEAKSYFSDLWVVAVKSRYDLVGH